MNIEINEKRLKDEIIKEFQLNKNKLKVCYENSDGHFIDIYLQSINVETCEEAFSESKKYARYVFSSFGYGLENCTIDKLIEIYMLNRDSNFIVFSARGISRVIMAKIIYKLCHNIKNTNLEKLLNIKHKDLENNNNKKINTIMQNPEVYNSHHNLVSIAVKGDYKIINNLLYILENKKSKLILDQVLDSCEIKHDYRMLLFQEIFKLKILKEKDYSYVNIILSRYLTLIVCTDYLLLRASGSIDENFVMYVNNRYEYNNLFLFLDNNKVSNTLIFPLNKLLQEKIDSVNLKTTILLKSNQKIFNHEYSNKKYNIIDHHSIQNCSSNVFINLKEEPELHIENTSYVLRDIDNYDKNITYMRFLNKKKLENIEKNLKKDMEKEIEMNEHLSYYELTHGSLVKQYLKLNDPKQIFTTCEFFVNNLANVTYIKRPITSSVPFNFNIFDKILKIVRLYKLNESDKKIYLYAHTRKGRAAYVAIILELCNKDVYSNVNKMAKKNYEFIEILIKLLHDGNLALETVNLLFNKYFNLSIHKYIDEASSLKKIKKTIKKYFLLICFASYRSMKLSQGFEQWINGNKAVIHLYNELDNMDLDTLKIDHATLDQIVANQNGKILTSMMILKNDYFVGSIYSKLYVHVDGVRNLRIINIKNGLIVGLAMPTKKGVKNICNVIRKTMKCDKIDINWFCLREEPVIYINHSPFVLRHCNKPNENIVMTGVSTEIVENIENNLKEDIEKDDEILLYDEVLCGNIIKTRTKNVKVESVSTMKETYIDKDIIYHRIPITDEKIPIPIVIDRLYNLIKNVNEPKVVVFNCQMGRGRTTTGMIIAYLIFNFEKCKT
ncbi:hypothetical protein COBT_003111, partial [Conglomerata obtusa]